MCTDLSIGILQDLQLGSVMCTQDLTGDITPLFDTPITPHTETMCVELMPMLEKYIETITVIEGITFTETIAGSPYVTTTL